ncbi:Mariner Mos1 transposase [Eumeta japonica]|uniref:Mariner Mos1 transposase n=1 Tax=Eumeta variegata TaxID=151549 RepID=A0A4C1Y4J8_EUMVA|nr:Mariner Mos1 transposase [Eumeta japonica]
MNYLWQERRKRSWPKGQQAPQTTAKPGLTRNMLMLYVWRDWKSIIHYELLPAGKTINSDLYYQQLMTLKQEVEKKRPELINRKGVVFQHDNARSHTSLAIRQILRKFAAPNTGALEPRQRRSLSDGTALAALREPFVLRLASNYGDAQGGAPERDPHTAIGAVGAKTNPLYRRRRR